MNLVAALAAAHFADSGTTSTSATFGDPWWISLIKVVGVFVLLVVLTLFTIWAERRVVGRMQHRIGPNRVGPQGLLQSLMDGIKLALKEQILPKAADKPIYILAPLLSTGAAFLAFGVIPLGPEVSMFGYQTPLQVTDFPVAVLYVIAAASIGIYGIVLAGWSSGSTYPLLGGLRSTAQMISYEVAMGLSFVGVFLFAGTMATSGIVTGQQHIWYGLTLLPSFAIYCVSMVGETNRAPFDLPEAEGELVGGFHTEYSSLTFALFFLAEYVNLVTVSAMATTLFLGGWRAPYPLSIWAGANSGWVPLVWFLSKVMVFIFVFIWLRGTLPRLRYDQFMKLGWKFLIPVSLLWILAVATLRAANNEGATRVQRGAIGIGLVAVFLLISVAWTVATERRLREEEEAEEQRRADRAANPRFRDHPTPPLPGEDSREPVTVSIGASAAEDSDDAGEGEGA